MLGDVAAPVVAAAAVGMPRAVLQPTLLPKRLLKTKRMRSTEKSARRHSLGPHSMAAQKPQKELARRRRRRHRRIAQPTWLPFAVSSVWWTTKTPGAGVCARGTAVGNVRTVFHRHCHCDAVCSPPKRRTTMMRCPPLRRRRPRLCRHSPAQPPPVAAVVLHRCRRRTPMARPSAGVFACPH